jgi:hypothetical protein
MKHLKNERGIALVTSLLLTLIALAMVMALLYMITWQTKLSGANKRYKTAIEASQGGAEIFAKQVIPIIFANHTTAGLAGQLGFTADTLQAGKSDCLYFKLGNKTSDWGAKCGPTASSQEATQLPDLTLTLKGTDASKAFKVFSKIVDTVPGNSDLSGYDLLDSGAGVSGQAAGVSPKHIPAMYKIEVQGQQANNPVEKSKLSVLYAY